MLKSFSRWYGLFLASILLVAFLLPSPARAAGGSAGVEESLARATDFLIKQEQAGGRLLPWSYIALASAGENLEGTKAAEVCNSMLAGVLESGNMTDYAALVLAVVASGGDPYNYQGHDLIAIIKNARMENGKFADNVKSGGVDLVSAHAYAIVALTAAGADVPDKEKALAWLAGQQHEDGSFNWYAPDRKTSDPDSTGMALVALGLLGEDQNSPVVKKALAYLEGAQLKNGSFASWGADNTESCAKVLEGLVAVGVDPTRGEFGRKGSGLLTALLRRQLADGSFEHIDGGGSDEIATQQAVIALNSLLAGKPLSLILKSRWENSRFESASGREVQFTVGKLEYVVDEGGERRVFASDAATFVENGRTYVPVRYLARALGVADADITWDGASQTAVLVMGDRKVSLTVGRTTGYFNGEAKEMDVAPLIVKGRVFLPARYVAEAFGYQVSWDEVNRVIKITG